MISIHAPREGGDSNPTQYNYCYVISIHAPREGGDDRVPVLPHIGPVISIHAPREGGDFWIQWMLCDSKGFQSTPPVRGATIVF